MLNAICFNVDFVDGWKVRCGAKAVGSDERYILNGQNSVDFKTTTSVVGFTSSSVRFWQRKS